MKKTLLINALFICLFFVKANAQVQALTDTSLELSGAGGANWTSTSTNFTVAFCSVASCGTCNGPCVPRTGTWYVWFGGFGGMEIGTLSQTFNLANAGNSALSFWLKIPNPGDVADSVSIYIDGALKWHKLGNDSVGFQNAYAKVTAQLGSLSSGSHSLTLRGVETGNAPGVFNALIDDITLLSGGSVGSSEIDFTHGVSIYSNYLEQKIDIGFNLMQTMDVNVVITDMLGKVIGEKKLSNVKNEQISFDSAPLAAGIYNVKIYNQYSSLVKKITVNK